MKTCSNCGEAKDISKFRSNHNHNQCNDCKTKKDTIRVNTSPDTFFRVLLKSAKSSARFRANKGRTDAGQCTIILQDIHELWKTQNGLCYYSQIPMVLKRYSDWRCSLERMDPAKGYILTNVCLIVSEFQGVAQWSKEKYDEFLRLFETKHEKQVTDWDKRLERKSSKHRQTIVNNDIEHHCCNTCEIYKPADDFCQNKNRECKACQKNSRKAHRATPNGRMNAILCDMRSSSKQRNHDPPTVDLQDLIKIFENQNGLCYYTNIPMTFGSYLDKRWTCSPERKDVKIGYTKENIAWVCWEFNTSDNSARCKDTELVTGNGAWSQEKISFLRKHIDVTLSRGF
jgi:hypothetical protein